MKRVAGLVAVSGGLGVLYGINPESFLQHLESLYSNQIAQAGFFFTLAAFVHAGRVKTEIRAAFGSLTDSINNLGNTLSLRIDQHEKMLKEHQLELDKLVLKAPELQSK